MPKAKEAIDPRGAVQEVEEYLRSLPATAAAQLRALVRRDYYTCDCPLPYVERKWSEALGTFCEIRLCCMARAVEQLTGQRLFDVWDFAPLWEWDCEAVVTGPDGEKSLRGCPPDFMLERMRAKGIHVMHGDRPHGDAPGSPAE